MSARIRIYNIIIIKINIFLTATSRHEDSGRWNVVLLIYSTILFDRSKFETGCIMLLFLPRYKTAAASSLPHTRYVCYDIRHFFYYIILWYPEAWRRSKTSGQITKSINYTHTQSRVTRPTGRPLIASGTGLTIKFSRVKHEYYNNAIIIWCIIYDERWTWRLKIYCNLKNRVYLLRIGTRKIRYDITRIKLWKFEKNTIKSNFLYIYVYKV